MALKTPVVDRIPTYPGRVTLTPVSGQTNTYDLVRADQPIEEGTPLNKLLFDQKAYTLTDDVIVYVSKSGSDATGDGTSGAPYATIQKAVDSLPKWLDGHMASISIAAGTYEERVELYGFQGGIVDLGTSGASVTVRGVQVTASSLVRINVNITRSASVGGTPLNVRLGSCVQFGNDCVINGASGNTSGIVVESGSALSALVDIFGYMTKTTISNCGYYAIYATGGSKVALGEIAGSGNGTGLYAADGGVISYSDRSLSATTMNVTVTGGRIYSGAQTNIPNY
jgi:hypothetical protein